MQHRIQFITGRPVGGGGRATAAEKGNNKLRGVRGSPSTTLSTPNAGFANWQPPTDRPAE